MGECGLCGKPRTPEGHDACIGTMPGVANACCGHGDTPCAYVQYWNEEYADDPNKHCIRGQKALDAIAAHRKGNNMATKSGDWLMTSLYGTLVGQKFKRKPLGGWDTPNPEFNKFLVYNVRGVVDGQLVARRWKGNHYGWEYTIFHPSELHDNDMFRMHRPNGRLARWLRQANEASR